MLLLHQTGSVRVGEVVRYTLTYTPSLDRILPPPKHLHLKIKNTSAIPLRAAYLHGPYTVYVAAFPATFDVNQKFDTADDDGEPDYEPQLKAGGHWSSKLTVPEHVRKDATNADRTDHAPRKSFTWIIEIASQVLFSTTAAVHFELIVGRDEKSASFGFTGVASGHGVPGKLEDHQQGRRRDNAQSRGVFTKAVKLRVDDTASLWNSPPFPQEHDADQPSDRSQNNATSGQKKKKKQKKVHLVLITHGIHSNLGADMLYLKEQIDATARQARKDAREHRRCLREKNAKEQNSFGNEAIERRTASVPEVVVAPTVPISKNLVEDSDDEDEEENVIVRGFSGNACKTERGLQYLGKRLAKYALSITYPDQPYLPVKRTITQSISRTFTGGLKNTDKDGKQPAHKNSTITKNEADRRDDLPYKITSISFVGHSLGGLTQTYAIAYIQKHSPEFFDKIKPINFVALATPFLGLSNENPMYVKFALDFGLVGRTGQDLGLTWRAPTIAKSGWGAMVGGFGATDNSKESKADPGTKPLLRILPTGPAHVALNKFRNRSVYSNVVNDGIVPLRTSCLLFLDWRGLDRVEKARRENGLVGTMVNWGLNELTGHNASQPRKGLFEDLFFDSGDEGKHSKRGSSDLGSAVPQPDVGRGLDQETYDTTATETESVEQEVLSRVQSKESLKNNRSGPTLWSAFTNFFKPQSVAPPKKLPSERKQKIYRRGQIMRHDSVGTANSQHNRSASEDTDENEMTRKLLVRGPSLYSEDPENGNLVAPPKTTVFESAGDLLSPPLPPKDFILDPEARARTIFHDRVYHPEDIPPPPLKRHKTFIRRPSSSDTHESHLHQDPSDSPQIGSSPTMSGETGTMRIEEKIARAYHKDMSWRKVLVRLEPDAHNNIIVRRMFANAYGWPVVKHMCDTHFAYTAAAKTGDDQETSDERAQPQDVEVGPKGETVQDQTKPPSDKKISELQHKGAALAKAPSAEDVHFLDKDENELKSIHQRQEKIRAARVLEQNDRATKSQRQQQQKQSSRQSPISHTGSRSGRTPSELRESRDEVADLVSMVSAQGEPNQSYSSMHSGTAALQRLNRQDSGRWSDRFFEGSEDEEEDDDDGLNNELNNAFNRGERIGLSSNLSGSPKSTRSGRSERGTGSTLKATAGRSRQPIGKLILGDDTPDGAGNSIFDEPEPLSRQISREAASEIPDAQTLSLTGTGISLGLGKTPNEVALEAASSSPTSTKEKERSRSSTDMTVSEHVARTSWSSIDAARTGEPKP